MQNTLADLDALVASKLPLVFIESVEEGRLVNHLKAMAALRHENFYLWTLADGLHNLTFKETLPKLADLKSVLYYLKDTLKKGAVLLLDIQHHLSDPLILRLIKEFAEESDSLTKTMLLMGEQLEVPHDLKRLGHWYIPPLPDLETIREIYFEELFAWLSADHHRQFIRPGPMEDEMVQALVGLNEEDVRRLIAAAVRDGKISSGDLKLILNFKKEDAGGDGLVEFDFDVAGLDGVGGLAQLKHWLSLRREAFLNAQKEIEIAPPKGVLLLGVQGSGKSLAAKAIAGTWHVPLMRLDFGNLYSKWLGESEHNLKHALQQAEAMAPCVLWIDEIEKGIANDGDSADGGVSKRILGTLLTWMAERKARVFMVATANDVSKLPPELLRKGRFDELFFVDLPGAGVRRDIFSIHLKKRKLNPRLFDLPALADASEGFAGAEIEQAVIAGFYRALGNHQPPATQHLLDELHQTQPLSVLMAEKMTALRSWAAGRTVKAD